MNVVAEFPSLANTQSLRQIEVEYDAETMTLYWWMNPTPRACFNSEFLEEVERFESRIEQHQGWFQFAGRQCKVENAVFGSRVPGIFNLGGDLSMFIQAILRKDRKTLAHYGELCVRNMYRRVAGFNAGIATYSLLQGKAFGGGFECALASEVIVAERGATLSFPEVLFNMFPGMGALSLLGRKIGLRKAEEVIMSGNVYTAKQMYDLGVVDEICEDGSGLETTKLLIRARTKKRNSYRALSMAKRQFQPISQNELLAIVDVWVDAAMRLETRDLKMMARLVRAQDKLADTSPEDAIVERIFAPAAMAVNS
ncbi:MAG: crotonase/enoyl-CoA hydratase family protein [Acidobacteriaceae bacterium]